MRSLALFIALVPAVATTAFAAEGEKTLSVGINAATFTVEQGGEGDSATAIGGTVSADFAVGVTDALWVRGGAFGGGYGAGGLAWSGGATAGILYAFDVVKYVPYVELGVGAMAVGGGDVDTAVKLLVELGIGLEILQSPTFSFGVNARFDSFASGITNLTFGPRVTWRWGYF